MAQQIKNFSRFYSLLKVVPGLDPEEWKDFKRKMVLKHTGYRTDSLRDMEYREYYRMIEELEYRTEKHPDLETIKSYRSSILLRLQRIGINTTSWDDINKFLKDPRIAGKLLFQMSVPEMKALIPKLEKILLKKIHMKNEILRQTLLN